MIDKKEESELDQNLRIVENNDGSKSIYLNPFLMKGIMVTMENDKEIDIWKNFTLEDIKRP